MARTVWTYCTADDVELRIPDLQSYLDHTPAPADTDLLLEEMCAYAEGELHAYVSGNYTVPLAGGQDNYYIKNIIIVLIEYKLCERMGRAKITERVQKAYEKAIKELTEIMQGKMLLPGETKSGAGSVITTSDINQVSMFEDL